MDITNRTRLGHLLDDHPELMDVFQWYEVPVSGADLGLSVEEFCRANQLDMDDLLVEFDAARADDGDDYSIGDEGNSLEGLFDEDEDDEARLDDWY